MRIKTILSAVAVALSLAAAAPQSAEAFHWKRHDRPDGWGHARTVRHWVYYPRYRHVYHSHRRTDPHAYRYEPRGYYPYYNSHYWGRPRIKRHRAHFPRYHRAWGAPRRHYRHREWHEYHHGGHRRGHW